MPSDEPLYYKKIKLGGKYTKIKKKKLIVK
jgi:hypothetical protein